MLSNVGFSYQTFNGTISEIDDQVNTQLRYILSTEELNLVHFVSPQASLEEIGEGILDKISIIVNKLIASKKDRVLLEDSFRKVKKSYNDLNERFCTSQEELACSDRKVTEAITNYGQIVEALRDSDRKLNSSESLYSDLELRYNETKREDLKLKIESREYENKCASLQELLRLNRTRVQELREKIVELEYHISESNKVGANVVKEVDEEQLVATLSVQEKRKQTRQRNKIYYHLVCEFEKFRYQFSEVQRKYGKLPENKRTLKAVISIRELFLETDKEYRAFLEPLGTYWDTDELRQLKNKADTERVTQSNFIRALRDT